MNRIIAIWIVVFVGWLLAGEMESHIIVAYGKDASTIQQSRQRLEQTLHANAELKRWITQTQAKITVEQLGALRAVRLGPFVPDKQFALIYLTIRDAFPQAIVIEQPRRMTQSKTSVSRGKANASHAKGVVVFPAPVVEEEDDTTIWIALFGLAVIGILYMFLSSDQLRRLKEEHTRIEERQKKMEIKQHSLLAQMGEEIHTLAKKTASQTQVLAQKAQGTLSDDDVQKVIDGEKNLLGMTADMIKFLQIKAHKVAIQAAPFDFNNVLHEIAGTLDAVCGKSDKELVFDVTKRVPRVLKADSVHMAQVLSNLIEYLMCHTNGTMVTLKADVKVHIDKKQTLEVTVESAIGNIDEEKFFDAYYDEATGKYVGLGLFVAKELVELMGGTLYLKGGEHDSTRIHLLFPVGERMAERRQYRLPDPSIMNAHVLIVDRNLDVMRALEHLLGYFKIKTTRLAVQSLEERIPDFSPYDIVAIDNTLWNASLIEALRKTRQHKKLHVISLENLYASQEFPDEGIADIRMKKPLTQQHVLDVLIQLESLKETPQEEHISKQTQKGILEVFRGDFEDNQAVRLEDFSCFAGRRLLIVEDNLVNQKVLKGMLSKAGLKLSVANNGQEALDMLEENSGQFDMILMDISMPIMDGFTATQRIHADERYTSIPIVTLTALVSDHEIDKMFEVGANGYLSKPLKIGKLFSAMKRFLPIEEEKEKNVSSRQTPRESIETGLDREHAMGSMRSDALLYREVLDEFKEIYGKSDEIIEKLIRDMRYEQLRTLCVDLRGLSGSIGARGLFEIVTEIQTLLLYKKYELLERQIEPYREELTRLNTAIDRYLG